mgnify:CR=1 FL=1
MTRPSFGFCGQLPGISKQVFWLSFVSTVAAAFRPLRYALFAPDPPALLFHLIFVCALFERG